MYYRGQWRTCQEYQESIDQEWLDQGPTFIWIYETRMGPPNLSVTRIGGFRYVPISGRDGGATGATIVGQTMRYSGWTN